MPSDWCQVNKRPIAVLPIDTHSTFSAVEEPNLEFIRKNSGFNYSFIVYELHLPQPHYSALCTCYVHQSTTLWNCFFPSTPTRFPAIKLRLFSVLVTTTLPTEPPHQHSLTILKLGSLSVILHSSQDYHKAQRRKF